MNDIQRILNGQNKDPENFIKKQTKQYDELRKAGELIDEGKSDEAINILEKIFYKDGYIGRGFSWPDMLSNIYMKNKMYDKCWKYLNYISAKGIGRQHIIRELQAKIHKAEGRHLDALLTRMASILIKYNEVEFKPTIEKVEKDLSTLIIKAELIDKKDDIINLYNKYIKSKMYKFDEIAFTDAFKKIVKKNTSED